MASRLAQNGDTAAATPLPAQNHLDPSFGVNNEAAYLTASSAPTDFATASANPVDPSPLSQSAGAQNYGRFNEEWDASQRGSSLIDGPAMQRSNSVASHVSHGGMSQGETLIPSRGGTLKKKASLRRGGSLKRNSSKRSSRAGSVRSLVLHSSGDDDNSRSVFFCPVPTTGNPTEVLANRFNAWRKVLKDLITYFREIQTQYDHRAKSLLKVSNVINNISTPPVFLSSGGIDDALDVLRSHHKKAIAEANKAKEIENDVILALTGLRSDLHQKIKEIKSLSGDFKNSVDKEMDHTRKAVNTLQEALGRSDVDTATMTGKQDPYLLRLAVDRQVERQLDEESYLHQAYLNLEASGRELESIVVGEIQKSYNALAGILKREADEALNAVDELRTGPIAMPKDHEWMSFVEKDENFVDPRVPIRSAETVQYPGRDSELAAEVRAGLLERKSKYLKSYTPGWYVLSPTHLHEFKSADKSQAPVMSLYLPEQKLGSHSTEGSSSNKFMLKGRQTGSMHRGHSWVFRAESYDTMMAWYEDIKSLTEKTPQERNAYVRQHARSFSGTSQRAPSISSDGVVDEEDEEPFSANASAIVASHGPKQDRRPQAGGRFPSDIQVNAQRGLQAPLSPSSGSSNFGDVQDRDIVAAASGLPGSGIGNYDEQNPSQIPAHDETTYHDTGYSTGAVAGQSQQTQNAGYAEQTDNYTYQPQPAENTVHETFIGGAYEPHQSTQYTEPYQQQPEQQFESAQYMSDVPSQPTPAAEPTPSTHDVVTPILANETNTASNEQPLNESQNAGGHHINDEIAVGESAINQPPSETMARSAEQRDTYAFTDGIATRPPLGEQKNSLQSISKLHVPGEYPRGTPVTEKPNAGFPV